MTLPGIMELENHHLLVDRKKGSDLKSGPGHARNSCIFPHDSYLKNRLNSVLSQAYQVECGHHLSTYLSIVVPTLGASPNMLVGSFAPRPTSL